MAGASTGTGACGPAANHSGKVLAISLNDRELVITRYSASGSYFTDQFTLPADNRVLSALRDDLTALLTKAK